MNKSFKNTYRLGMLVFIITTLFTSVIFGALFRSCSSESVVNVNVMGNKKETAHDTLYMDSEVPKVIHDTIRIPIKPIVKTTVSPKTDTVSK